jgi:hypothetical protein
MSKEEYTQEEYNEFSLLVDKINSTDNCGRVVGRIQIREFIQKHTKEKCDVMFVRHELENPTFLIS